MLIEIRKERAQTLPNRTVFLALLLLCTVLATGCGHGLIDQFTPQGGGGAVVGGGGGSTVGGSDPTTDGNNETEKNTDRSTKHNPNHGKSQGGDGIDSSDGTGD